MRTTDFYIAIAMTAMLYLAGCNRVSETESNFDNVVYIEAAASKNTENVAVKVKDEVLEQTLQASLALPLDQDVNVTFKVDFSLVSLYNAINGTECQALPEDFFEMPSKEAVIVAGNVRSTEVTVRFKNLLSMPTKISYVLPITLENANGVNILNGSKTIYYLLKKGAPIVVAANINETYLQLVAPATTKQLNGLSKVTMEALVNIHDWGTDAGISTFMGVEAYFLVRIGDDGWPKEQIQFSTSASDFGDKWPPADNNKLLKKDVWTHIAFTMDLTTRETIIYVNGKVQSRDFRGGTATTVNLSPTSGNLFYIGKSYNNSRYLRGEICEARIWNVIRTQEEIDACKYGEGIEAGMSGLSAWWKFDEGKGNNIYDYSGNDNHLTAGAQDDGVVNPIKWIDVEVGLE
ncbi:MAG: DUF1735 and LamG domain-containing protein [Dysgonamonadaceae bacterium]|jgi:hypothetical protein|nr:DUF1735 and LamG domain-containing protein [Dysgonamonadaceae bacterium]